jgi:4-aminobutyrate aminotransferase-like enzyme
MIDRARLSGICARERANFVARHPRSAAAYDRSGHLFGQVPMTWMNKNAGGFPIYLERAQGNRIWDIDGFEYVDFALGDTGAMAEQLLIRGDRGGSSDAHCHPRWYHHDAADRGRGMGGSRAHPTVRA